MIIHFMRKKSVIACLQISRVSIFVINNHSYKSYATYLYYIIKNQQAYLNCSSGNRRTVLDFKEQGLTDDHPDGMTIDTDGNLWLAHYNGRKVTSVISITDILLCHYTHLFSIQKVNQ